MAWWLLLPVLGLAAEPHYAQLRAAEATASSFLVSNWNKYSENYHPSYVLDGDPRTAWVEGVEGNGEGETLTIPLSRLASARSVKVRVRNGYQKSDALLTANAAPNAVVLSLLDGRRPVASIDTTLDRVMGWQDRVIEVPPSTQFDALQLRIVSVHPGRTYKDTCVSDVEVWVDSDVPYDAAAEERKHAALTAWIAERVRTAAYFASQPATYPFAHTHYDRQVVDVEPASLDEDLAGWRANGEALAATPTWYRAAVSKPLERLPDGADGLRDLMSLFVPGDVAFFESDQEAGVHHPVDYEAGWWAETWYSNYKIRWADEGRKVPAAAWFRVKDVVEERGVTTTHTDWYVEWDDRGRLTDAFAWGGVKDDEQPSTFERRITFAYDDAGKIATYTSRSRSTVTYLYASPPTTDVQAALAKFFGPP